MGKTENQIAKRVLISLPDDMLQAIDREAKAYFMSRSELLRHAFVWWYTQPQAQFEQRVADLQRRDADEESLFDKYHADPEELFTIIQRQKARAGIRILLRDMKQQRAAERASKHAKQAVR